MSLAIFKTIVQKGKTFHGVINKQEGWGQVLSYFNNLNLNVFQNANSSRERGQWTVYYARPKVL